MLLTKTFGKDSSPLVDAAEVPTCCTPSEFMIRKYSSVHAYSKCGEKSIATCFLKYRLEMIQ